jgi:hypothetical protein
MSVRPNTTTRPQTSAQIETPTTTSIRSSTRSSTRNPTSLARILATPKSPLPASLCPGCGRPGLKAGSRRTATTRIQRFYCRTCKRHFGAMPIPRRQYPPKVILDALSAYNMGHTLADTRAKVARSGKVPV